MRGSFSKIGHEFVDKFLDNKVGRALNPMPLRSGGPDNPLNLFNAEQMGKLSRMSSADFASSMKSYMAGGRMKGGPGNYTWDGSVANHSNARMRKTAAAIGGGMLLANALDLDPMGGVTAMSTLGTVGLHGAAGSAIRKMDVPHAKLAGTAYLAATAVNAFRQGNNFGPL